MTPTRKIMLACPTKGTTTPRFTSDVVQALTKGVSGVVFDLSLLDGPAIQFARNILVHQFLRSRNDALFFLDADVPFNADNVARLLSHDEPIVCGLYAARSLDTVWTTVGIKGEEANADGLLKVSEASLGFSKITREAFVHIAKDNPDRRGLMASPGSPATLMQDFFPMGLCGPNCADTRLGHMKALLKTIADTGMTPDTLPVEDLRTHLKNLERLLLNQYPEMNVFRGEDYYFCRLARQAGIDVLLDTKLILGHDEVVTLPIPTEQLQKMLEEPWRKA